MTQSGQGDERQLPAVRPAHEGVVLPADGGAPWTPGAPPAAQPDQAAPAGGRPWGQPWGPQATPQEGHAPGQLPPEQQAPGSYAPQHGQYQAPQQSYAPQEQQHQQGAYQQHQQDAYPQPQTYAQPLPPENTPGAGQAGAQGMGQGGDADATQYIAPVPGGSFPGGLPPERPAESTQYLGRSAASEQPSDADATQYIPPVPGGAPYGIRPGAPGDRQPPAEFDSLFRSEEPAGATQQMPRFDPGQQQAQQQHRPYQAQQPQSAQPYQSGLQNLQGGQGGQGGPGGQAGHGGHGGHGGYGADEPDQGHGPQRRRSPHIPLIAAVVIGCAVIGLGAGALLSGGDESPDDKQPVASRSSSAAEPTEAAADPAKPQAEALDKLLADSNNSRAAVISAVEKIRGCRALDQAETDLTGAATQRRSLVTRLEALSVDQLPDHEQLKTSLTKAWQASAEADDHYAAWARQAKDDKKVCKGGKARTTDETNKGNASSSDATIQKRKASGLWNSIARKYTLTERAPTQL
ncbi:MULTISPECIES: hypothetical protein [unclassified Streptomyces]|uniref:hypothetical protein n=1 Tax=unclassified Streptomyces TaxID=2593676 RepID=UPI000A4ACE27|nr:hypothetical protein [Streptomyces sp. CB02058]